MDVNRLAYRIIEEATGEPKKAAKDDKPDSERDDPALSVDA